MDVVGAVPRSYAIVSNQNLRFERVEQFTKKTGSAFFLLISSLVLSVGAIGWILPTVFKLVSELLDPKAPGISVSYSAGLLAIFREADRLNLFEIFGIVAVVLICLLFLSVLVVVFFYFFPFFLRRRPLVWVIAPLIRLWTLYSITDLISRKIALHDCLRIAADCHPIALFRKKLNGAAKLIEGGSSVEYSLKRYGLITSHHRRLLASLHGPEDLENAFDQIVEAETDRLSSRYHILADAMMLVTILLVALVIGR